MDTFASRNYLAHFGIKGQKWGRRRYQNPDGSLTPEGKKRYASMTDDELSDELRNQVKEALKEKRGPLWDWIPGEGDYGEIGQYSKAMIDKRTQDAAKHYTKDKTEKHEKKVALLTDKYDRGEIDYKTYMAEVDKSYDSIHNPKFDSQTRRGEKGRIYVKEYIEAYGKDINISYLRDLGYNESTAKALAERVLKANDRKILDQD